MTCLCALRWLLLVPVICATVAVVLLVTIWLLGLIIGVWSWLQDVLEARRRLRVWREFQARSFSGFFVSPETLRRHGIDPQKSPRR